MPKYDSLLLNCGGGIINRSQQSKQYRGAAALAIGIGGTGVAALAELKQKVYQQLEPDNPDSPVPEYQHIQFLAIDSDTTDIDRMRGMARLDREREFFSINNPNLATALREKDLIKCNASLNWMDIDRIGDLMLLGNLPVCPIRQVGRYLLISRASNLISTIQAKCTQALEGMTGSELDVYIFAGLSGGTGGGCFLDTCYIVQRALENMGRAQSANVTGLFFLPDVVNSKPQVASQPATVKYYSSNGYAAMKELDYLMSLRDADDWFRQDYGAFKIETQEPPVNMCYLISAIKSDGSLVPDGFRYCINRAIRTLNAKQLVQDFTEYLMKAPEEWSTRDDGKIGLYISEFMVKIFKEQTDRSLEDYLYEKYPAAGHNSALLAKEVNRNILGSVYNGAKPMFWCNPAFNKDTFDSSSLSVPANASAVCDAAEQFGSSHTQFYIRKTGLKNRIFALRFCSGIPFYAYAGISQLKAIYDNNTTTQYGVGAHLYTNTGRGQDDSGFHDWRNFLPVPMPYSYSPDLVDHAQELLALYDEGVKKQIIYTSDGQNYFIRQSAPQAMSEYKPEDFMANWQLDAGRLQKERKRLQDLLSGMYDPANGGRLVSLKNDGFKNDGTDVVNRVRKDYFMHYPMLQRIVRQELEKQEKIRRAMEQLDQIEKELTQYEADMTTFTNMVFYGMIECLSATGEPEYDRINKAFYKYRDRRGMETEKILVEDSKAFRFGKKYPLYEMFRSYRAMEPDEEPRQEMDEREAELRKQTRGANDHLIAASLEKRWNAKALQQLVRDTANETDEDKAEIRRFYEELVSRILGYKDVFTDEQWTRTSKVASNPAPAARTWTVSPGGSTSYTVYSDRSLQMAWDAVNNTWVPLTAGMWVLNKAGDDWDPIQLDAAGNIING